MLSARGAYYDDRLMIYIDNKVSDFRIEDDQSKTSIPDINNTLKDQNVRSIGQWLPKARPSDRNGDIYLNRYYVIEFESNKNNMDKIICISENTKKGMLLGSARPVVLIRKRKRIHPD